MVSLARETLLHEWRRYLPAALAIAFACLLQLLQAALVAGIFGSASVYVRRSHADLWVGYPGTQSVSLGRDLPPDLDTRLLRDRDVSRVEHYRWVDGDWRSAAGPTSVYLSGIDTRPDALLFADLLDPGLRARLREPMSVVVDASDTEKLGVRAGDALVLNGQRVNVVGLARGLRGLGGINVLSSLETARRLDPEAARAPGPTFLLVRLKQGALPATVAARLCCDPGFGRYEVWSADAFARRTERYWLFDTGAGAGILFLGIVVFVAGAAISGQALSGAAGATLREYATLNALGVGLRQLRRVVIEQAFWVGAAGVLAALSLGLPLLWFAQHQAVPVRLTLPAALVCCFLAMAVAAASGLAALRVLGRVQPATLLR